MAQSEDRVDQLFLTAEKLAKDFSLASEKDKAQVQDRVLVLLVLHLSLIQIIIIYHYI